MFKLISHLQHRPETERRRVALFTAIIITSVILAFWLYSFLTTTLSPKPLPDQAGGLTELATSSSVGPSPFATVKNAAAQVFEVFSQSFGRVNYYSGDTTKE